MKVQGKVFKYGNDVDTDVIIPARYLNTTSESELASHCMEDIDGEFIKKVQPGDIIVAGDNFGCGSSREHAPIAIIGLPIWECPEAAAEIAAGDEVRADLDEGTITDVTTGKTFKARPFPPFIQNIIEAGGLINSLKK